MRNYEDARHLYFIFHWEEQAEMLEGVEGDGTCGVFKEEMHQERREGAWIKKAVSLTF